MRISDWSSDVCSSDLQRGEGAAVGAVVVGEQQAGPACVADQFEQPAQALRVVKVGRGAAEGVEALRQDRTAQALAPCAETEQPDFGIRVAREQRRELSADRKSTRLNSSH